MYQHTVYTKPHINVLISMLVLHFPKMYQIHVFKKGLVILTFHILTLQQPSLCFCLSVYLVIRHRLQVMLVIWEHSHVSKCYYYACVFGEAHVAGGLGG